jgi:hypothetical protein
VRFEEEEEEEVSPKPETPLPQHEPENDHPIFDTLYLVPHTLDHMPYPVPYSLDPMYPFYPLPSITHPEHQSIIPPNLKEFACAQPSLWGGT